jgi:2-oxoglutarate ferredoxin oxidoreductase subunit alpha
LRLKALPCTAEVEPFLAKYPRIYVVEQNRDGQMAGVLKAEFPKLAAKLRSVLHYDGLPCDAASVTEGVLRQEGRALESVGAGARA